jgi:hypothetical protein
MSVTSGAVAQSSPVSPTSSKRNAKGKKESPKATSRKKDNATNAKEHDVADAEEHNAVDVEEHSVADMEEQVVEGSAQLNSNLADCTVVMAVGSTRSTEKPLPTPATKSSKRSAGVKKVQLPLQLERKSRGHVTNHTRRKLQFDPLLNATSS